MRKHAVLLLAFLLVCITANAQDHSVDAALNCWNESVYIFKGNQYIRYDIAADKADPGYPKPLNGWSGLGDVWTGVDAAVEWSSGKAYFFKGDQYIRYDLTTGRADAGYPLPLNGNNWPGIGNVWTSIDAAVNWGTGKAYFFKGGEYIRYDIATDKADPGYPQPVNGYNWPGLGNVWTSFDAAVNWGNGKVYFFKGDQYIRYDIAADKADPGYPLPVNGNNWPGLVFPGPPHDPPQAGDRMQGGTVCWTDGNGHGVILSDPIPVKGSSGGTHTLGGVRVSSFMPVMLLLQEPVDACSPTHPVNLYSCKQFNDAGGWEGYQDWRMISMREYVDWYAYFTAHRAEWDSWPIWVSESRCTGPHFVGQIDPEGGRQFFRDATGEQAVLLLVRDF